MSLSRLIWLASLTILSCHRLTLGQQCTPGLHEDQIMYPWAEWPLSMQTWLLSYNMGFGWSVAMEGTTAVIGAPAVSAPYFGRAFVRRVNGNVWTPHQVLVSPESVNSDWFGISVAISPDGSLVIVGAFNNDGFSVNNGAAYVFRLDPALDQWVFEQKLVPADGAMADEFGCAVAISNDRAVVGARLDDANGVDSGSAYVFEYDGASWDQQVKLVASDGAGGDWFGGSVAIANDTVLAGAQRNDHAFINAGAAYVFTFDAKQWVQAQKLTALDAAENDRFGNAVDLIDGVAIIGAWWNDYQPRWGPSTGSAFVYKLQGGQWNQVQQLIPDEPELNLQFGADVAISPQGDLVVIGALGQAGGAMARCYLFRNAGSFVAEKYVYPSYNATPTGSLTQFGNAVDVEADHMLIGASSYGGYGFISQPGCGAVFSSGTQMVADCDNNGEPDWCQIENDSFSPPSIDCNQNEILDACEILAGESDCNGNGDPDAQCQISIDYELQDENAPTLSTYVYGSDEAKDLIWLNQFNVVPGKERITQVGIRWAYCANYTPAKLVVYDDPNNDGDPNDAILLSSTDILSGPLNSHGGEERIMWRHAITPTNVGQSGQSFFIGAVMTTNAMPISFPALATYSSIGRAWMFKSPAGTGSFENPAKNQELIEMNGVRFALVAFAHDCNGNGEWDACDIADGLSIDRNSNNIPDECEAQCVSDLTENGLVDVDDLLTVINSWGKCVGPNTCLADIAPPGGNGMVDVDDLLVVINSWGPCQ